MITREQVADLRKGDTLELGFVYAGTKLTARGVFPEITDWYDNYLGGPYTLTVVSRVPRPLYVNHPRTKPVPGDVVRGADDPHDARVWLCGHADEWWRATGFGLDNPSATWTTRRHLPAHLCLLVDGETGMAVTA